MLGRITPADAKACKGSTEDSYMNNPRYVGVTDNGPIPEGEAPREVGVGEGSRVQQASRRKLPSSSVALDDEALNRQEAFHTPSICKGSLQILLRQPRISHVASRSVVADHD